jgi:outer membrane cobalamin receptor
MSAGGGLLQVTTNYFRQQFGDLIQFVSGGPPDFKGSYANLTAASSDGYEAELHVNPPGAVRGSASYTVVKPRVTKIPPGFAGGGAVGDALLRRPGHSGNAVVYLNSNRFNFSVAASYVGKRPDLDFAQFPSPRVTLPAYTKVDVSMQFPLADSKLGSVSLDARVENLFDKRYQDVLHFPAPGRTLLAGGRISAGF